MTTSTTAAPTETAAPEKADAVHMRCPIPPFQGWITIVARSGDAPRVVKVERCQQSKVYPGSWHIVWSVGDSSGETHVHGWHAPKARDFRYVARILEIQENGARELQAPDAPEDEHRFAQINVANEERYKKDQSATFKTKLRAGEPLFIRGNIDADIIAAAHMVQRIQLAYLHAKRTGQSLDGLVNPAEDENGLIRTCLAFIERVRFVAEREQG